MYNFVALSGTKSRISTIWAKWSIIDQWSIISTLWPPCNWHVWNSTISNKNTRPGESKRPSAVTAQGTFSWLTARYCTWVSFRVSPLNHRGFWLDAVAKIATGQEHTGLSRSKQQHLVAVVCTRKTYPEHERDKPCKMLCGIWSWLEWISVQREEGLSRSPH